VVVDGTERRDATVTVDGRLVVGETELAVERRSEGGAIDVATLFTGADADPRGLAAIVALTEALDSARHRDELSPALLAWARRYVPATAVAIVEDGDRVDRVVSRPTDEGVTVLVPTVEGAAVGLRFDVPAAPADVGIGIMRLMAVAGRLCGSALARLTAVASLEREAASLRRIAVGSARAFLGESEAAARVARVLSRLASSDVVALIEGETGVGKTFFARLIHETGGRAREPLRVVNCAAIPENLVESELFGHERGSFTGASAPREGVFESAGAGTVLLDEVGDLPLGSQAKLLHVLEDRAFSRIGSTRAVPLRARVLVATNRDLDAMVAAGTFRRDLFFRVSTVRVVIPPLRERGDDLMLLANQLLADLRASLPRRIDGFADDAIAAMRGHSWPGNVRELRNVIEHAAVLGDGSRIRAADLPDSVRPRAGAPVAAPSGRTVALPASLAWLEREAIDAALEAAAGNRRRAAEILGINRVTLYKKLRV